MSLIGNISNIARASLHDGPGVRTVVYFKGCGLECRWCHNPETLSAGKDILYAPIKCICCGRCIEACPEHHTVGEDKMSFLREGCARCGRCADVCPTGALSVSGKGMSVDEVMKEILKDAHYYDINGGVTLSGGECLLQAEFCAALLSECRARGIHTAVETALFLPWAQAERVIPLCDLIFADFKIPDARKHREYTGQDNGMILDNLEKCVQAAPGRVLVRIPLIPGVNDGEEDLNGFAAKMASFAQGLMGIEVLRYNALAQSKYSLAGKEYTEFGAAQTDEELLKFCEELERRLDGKTKVFATL